jgi:hypothetical protein
MDWLAKLTFLTKEQGFFIDRIKDLMMRRIPIIIFSIILLSGCAGLRTKPAPEGNFVDIAQIGIITEYLNNKVIVKSTGKDSPAELSGVKTGDIIISGDGKIITSKMAFLSLMENKRLSDRVLLTVNRDGQIINFEIAPKVVKLRPTGIKMRSIVLGENKKMTVAVIVGEVKNSFPNAQRDWADSVRNNLQSDHERYLLSAFGKSENFSVVDRSRLKQILDEFQFSHTGFVSDKLRAKIGEMTGATHLLDISFGRFRGHDYDYDDILNARLVEIESGKVLAVDRIITH